MVQLNQNVIKGQGRLALISLNPGSSGQIIPVPYPVGFTFDPQIEVRELRTQGPLAVSELTRLVEQAANPLVTLSFPATMLVFAMLFNAQWEDAASVTVQIPKQFPVTSGTFAAATSGTEGFGVAEDAAATGSYVTGADSTKHVPMTRVAYGSFNSATDDTFAIGANAEILIADNIVNAADTTASFLIPNTLSNIRSLGENPFDTFKVNLNLILVDLSIVTMEFPSLQIRPDSRAFDPTAEGLEIQMNKLYDGSGCGVNPTIHYLGQAQKVAC